MDEDFLRILEKIREAGVTPGIALPYDSTIEDVKAALRSVSKILLLAIPRPGISGQHFQEEIFRLVREINELPDRNNFDVCVDGGINLEISQKLDVEKIVSASFVLSGQDSRKCIINLQTEGKYAANYR